MSLDIFLIEELSMTWNIRPSHGSKITTLTVSSNNIYTIDITSLVEGRNNISICVSYDAAVNDYAIITSKEDTTFNEEDFPQLIWTYQIDFRVFELAINTIWIR